MASSSAMTRSPLSEAMKFTVFTRESDSTVSRKCFRNIDPLAPVVAMVRFSGAGEGNVLGSTTRFRGVSKSEHRVEPRASQGGLRFVSGYRFSDIASSQSYRTYGIRLSCRFKFRPHLLLGRWAALNPQARRRRTRGD